MSFVVVLVEMFSLRCFSCSCFVLVNNKSKYTRWDETFIGLEEAMELMAISDKLFSLTCLLANGSAKALGAKYQIVNFITLHVILPFQALYSIQLAKRLYHKLFGLTIVSSCASLWTWQIHLTSGLIVLASCLVSRDEAVNRRIKDDETTTKSFNH